ncbi:MAG: xanthine dehydrogenase molybdopterin binding subunit [Candidatus Melainabacteria bacterium HGW-Melainabacteria-1]|nr:MAG: xanthine dehydrogenase molybdopterin binding subunit [Candidatus Melainabacteria bacterium HGW-Melainabacteria-1]
MSSRSIPHDSSWGHVTGQSIFIDDRPALRGELHVGLVTSPVAHGKLLGLNPAAALALEGVAGIWTALDLHHNIWGTIIQDQPLLVDQTISYLGEPIAIIAADDREILKQALKLVQIEIEELPPILSIDEARAQQAFIAVERKIERGDVAATLANAPYKLSGRFENKGQDHFYLESHCCVVYPGEQGQLEVHSSSQHPTEVQHLVAEALGLQQNQVACIVKRMGGGFGGKESQAAPFAAFAGLVALRTGRPARLVLSKDEDMLTTGKRHPFQTDYQVGFDAEGRILAAEIHLFSDGGAFADLSTSVLERAMLHSDNAYYLPEALITGRICRTHTPPNTAFRGFGGPQGVAVIEHILEDIAIELGLDAFAVRRRNCYQDERNVTPYGQVLENNVLPELFDKLHASASYAERRVGIDDFNRQSQTQLKGLAMTAVKFGISFTTRFLNQGNALVNVHRDGTVQVSTGATEMGQGVNTKISQIVAHALAIQPEQVIVMATSTERNANTSPTAASSGTDLNGAAAEVACAQIQQRLAACAAAHFANPVRGMFDELTVDFEAPCDQIVFADGEIYDQKNPSVRLGFAELVNIAYLNRVSLSGYGFFKTPGIGFDKDKGQGHPFLYFTNGVALSEVVIDRFTGELKVLRSDILIDLGRPINEAIDIGQVSGAFVQGMGWVTTEHLVYDARGGLLSHSPTTYKIPNIQDTPREFNIELLPNEEPRNVRGSKAVGEPPLLLGLSVWAAVKNALTYVSHGELPQLSIPATAEKILLELSRCRSLTDTAAAGKPAELRR